MNENKMKTKRTCPIDKTTNSDPPPDDDPEPAEEEEEESSLGLDISLLLIDPAAAAWSGSDMSTDLSISANLAGVISSRSLTYPPRK